MISKRIIFGGLAILMLFWIAYLFFQGNNAITNYPPKNKIIVAFGDSLIEGVGSTREGGFVSIVVDRLGVEIANKGKAGDTTEMGLSRIDETLTLEPGIVILLLGGNDVLRRIPKATTFQNLGMIIEKFQSNGSIVLLLGVRGGILGDGYEGDYDALAKKYHTAYVPNVLEGLIGNTEYMYDGIHPNDEGYRLIAERVSSVLKSVLW